MAQGESGTSNFEKGLPVGIGVGVALGAAIGVATDNMGLLGAGLAVGVGLAPAFGAAQNKNDKDGSGKTDRSQEDEQ
ncbi:MAG: hypothetical protein VX593_05540 [Pseudomonadota bacterium]|jgi:hypothetical protein|nr:hypothetical protein [Pseudomonadota bacterium]